MNLKNKKNIWIFAGETSGDNYGARLTKELNDLTDNNITVSGMGGAAMKEAGVNILVDSTELGVVGFVEVMKHIFTFIKIFVGLVKKAEKERPDAVVLIDYPGFNLRFAKQMYKRGIPVIWYVSPQVWVWGKRRIPKLAKYCKKMLVIFPFEVEVYAETGLSTEFTGNPRVDIVREKQDPNIKRNPEKFLLLPGSRFGEIDRLLEPMLETVLKLNQKHPKFKYMVSAERPAIKERIEQIINSFKAKNNKLPDIEIAGNRNACLLQQEAGTAIATSGTVTVECALNRLPIVSVYKAKAMTWIIVQILKVVFRLKLFRGFFTMPNIIANKMVYRELLQSEVNADELFKAVEEILPGGPRRTAVETELENIGNELTSGSDNASKNAAKAIIKQLG